MDFPRNSMKNLSINWPLRLESMKAESWREKEAGEWAEGPEPAVA